MPQGKDFLCLCTCIVSKTSASAQALHHKMYKIRTMAEARSECLAPDPGRAKAYFLRKRSRLQKPHDGFRHRSPQGDRVHLKPGKRRRPDRAQPFIRKSRHEDVSRRANTGSGHGEQSASCQIVVCKEKEVGERTLPAMRREVNQTALVPSPSRTDPLWEPISIAGSGTWILM